MEIFGFVIHDAAVSVTDLVLALESAIFAYLLIRTSSGMARTLVVCLFLSIAAASISGAVFHAFFPLKIATDGGWLIWLLTTAAAGITAVTLWLLAAYFAFGRVPAWFGAALFLAFGLYMYWIIAVDYRYLTVVTFYTPALLSFALIAGKNAYMNVAGWRTVFLGVIFTVLAALAQLSSIQIGAFDHNAIYHVIQALALAVLFTGFRRLL